jgi:hypothetical protein
VSGRRRTRTLAAALLLAGLLALLLLGWWPRAGLGAGVERSSRQSSAHTQEAIVLPPPPQPAATAAAADASAFLVTGRVVDRDGSPVAEAVVSAVPAGAAWTPRDAATLAVSADDGRYTLGCPTSGPFDIVCRHDRYREQSRSRVQVPADEAVRIDFTLTEGRSVSGRVTTRSGQPIANAVVTVRGRDGNRILKARDCVAGPGVEVHNTTTNANGEFRVEGLDDGLHVVHARGPGLSARVHGACRDTAVARPGDHIELVLEPTTLLQARAVDAASGETLHTAAWLVQWHSSPVTSLLRPARATWLGDNLVRTGPYDGASHLLRYLIVPARWPIPEGTRSRVRVHAPGYRFQDVEIPWQSGAGSLTPAIVKLERDTLAGAWVDVRLDAPEPLGPFDEPIVLVTRAGREWPAQLHVDATGRGHLGFLPAGRYRLLSHWCEEREYGVRAGERAVWKLVPTFGLVRVRPALGSGRPVGGVAVRVLPGFVAEIPDAGTLVRRSQTEVEIRGMFARAVGIGFEQEDEFTAARRPGEYTVELFRPGYAPSRTRVVVERARVSTIAPVLVPTTDATWPYWRDLLALPGR